MSEHYTLSTVSKNQLVNAFDLTLEEAKLIHKYRNQLPAIIDAEGEEGFCVDALVLHKQLNSKERFDKWLKSKTIQLSDGYDFCQILDKTNGRPKKNAMLSVDGAKQVAMMEKSEVGFTVRKYFILCEKVVIRMAKRNPIRQSCKDSTRGLFRNIEHRVPR